MAGGGADEAQAAVARGNHQEALRLALAAWREVPDPALADVVEGLSLRVLSGFKPPRPPGKDEFQKAWVARCLEADVAEVGWLARELGTWLPEPVEGGRWNDPGYLERRYAGLFERLKFLGRHSPDPRIAAGVVGVLEVAPFGASFEELAEGIYRPVLELIERNGDARQSNRLAALVASPRAKNPATRAYLARALPPLIARLSARERSLPEVERELWMSLGGGPARPLATATAGDLLGAVYAAPEDLTPRAVFADWLVEQGDAQGEFISLQLKDAREGSTAKERARANRLLKENINLWLGPLAVCLKKVEFKAGFLDAAELAPNSVAPVELWERAAQCPQLATVKALARGKCNMTHYARFVRSPHARALARIDIPERALLRALLQDRPRAFEHLSIEVEAALREGTGEDWARTFPRLASVDLSFRREVSARFEATLAQSPVAGIHTVRINGFGWHGTPIDRQVGPRFLAATRIQRLELQLYGGAAVFDRSGGELEVSVVDFHGWGWIELLGWLPPVPKLELVVPIDVTHPRGDPELHAQALRSQGVDVTLNRTPLGNRR